MSIANKPRLIEILMPLEQASILSPREKNVRSGGYISTFHVWPARRPLAACRAALLATLLPDPGDPAKRADLLKAIGGEVKVEQRESKDEDGNLVLEERPRSNGGPETNTTSPLSACNAQAGHPVPQFWGRGKGEGEEIPHICANPFDLSCGGTYERQACPVQR